MKIAKILNGLDYLDTAVIRSSGTIEIPNDIEEIGEGAFSHSLNLKKISFPQNVKKINQFAFCNCHNLSEMFFEGYIQISPLAFANCTSLTKITLSKKVYQELKYTPRLAEEYIKYLKEITNNKVKVKMNGYTPFEYQDELE